MTKGNKGFGIGLTTGLDDDEAIANPAAPSESIMASRSQTLARIAAGKVVTDRTEWVNPARCRPWRLHNRDLDHLNEDSCRDLIDAFLSAKKQRIPAIVRRLRGDPDHDFEIIAGVRRWWTVQWLRAHHHPDFEYLVTIQSVTDEEAFRVSDIENRSRKDITDWERAREYSQALAEFYNSNQSEMAEHLKISRSWLSRLLDVARLPDEVVAAFPDRHGITVRIARDIKPLTSDARTLQAMIAQAKVIASERDDLGVIHSAPEIAKRLVKAAAEPSNFAPTETEIRNADNKLVLRYARTRAGLTVKIPARGRVPIAQVLQAIQSLMEDV